MTLACVINRKLATSMVPSSPSKTHILSNFCRMTFSATVAPWTCQNGFYLHYPPDQYLVILKLWESCKLWRTYFIGLLCLHVMTNALLVFDQSPFFLFSYDSFKTWILLCSICVPFSALFQGNITIYTSVKVLGLWIPDQISLEYSKWHSSKLTRTRWVSTNLLISERCGFINGHRKHIVSHDRLQIPFQISALCRVMCVDLDNYSQATLEHRGTRRELIKGILNPLQVFIIISFQGHTKSLL